MGAESNCMDKLNGTPHATSDGHRNYSQRDIDIYILLCIRKPPTQCEWIWSILRQLSYKFMLRSIILCTLCCCLTWFRLIRSTFSIQNLVKTRATPKWRKRRKTDRVESFCIRNCIHIQICINKTTTTPYQISQTRAHIHTHFNTSTLDIFVYYFVSSLFHCRWFAGVRRICHFALASHSILNTKQIDMWE